MIHLNLYKKLSSENGTLQLEIDLELNQGELFCIYGASGVGKTSILRMIAGLMDPEKGTIIVHDTEWLNTNSKVKLPPQKRKVGFLFQDYALFPNMTVLENLKFALEKGQDESIVIELIEAIELSDLQGMKTQQLSGGQKQRVALARALVRRPDVLMLDEPLSALDPSMRAKLQDYILKIHKKYHLTTILISHDISEVVKMADTVAILEKGKITKTGRPIDIFSNNKMSGKFQFTGEIVNIEKEDILFVVTVLIGTSFVKVVANQDEVSNLKIGNTVAVASKAFNPIIHKIEI